MSNMEIVDIAKSIKELAQASKPGIAEYRQLINSAQGLALYLGIDYEGINENHDDLTRRPDTSAQLKLIIQEFEDARSHIITSNIYLENTPSLVR